MLTSNEGESAGVNLGLSRKRVQSLWMKGFGDEGFKVFGVKGL